MEKFEIRNLNLHYGAFHALKDVNMKIKERTITAFIGPSGCGKSTFLKTQMCIRDRLRRGAARRRLRRRGERLYWKAGDLNHRDSGGTDAADRPLE